MVIMFSPMVESWEWLKAHNPGSPFKQRRLNFITIHCTSQCSYVNLNADEHASDLYILSVTIIGSILLYPAGGLNYIDALFFASGTATQSGLNTYIAGSNILSCVC